MKKPVTVLLLCAMHTLALAGPGHDHGDEASVAAGAVLPRVVMESDLFEAVGVLNGRTLEIFVDHAATNAPVQNATLDLQLNGQKVPLELHAEGEFDAVLPESGLGEQLAVALQVSVGDQSEVLTGTLLLADQGHAHEGHEEHADHAGHEEHGPHGVEYWVVVGAAALLALGLIAFFIKRRNKGVK
ncbi:hypothetical protein EV673_1542 [Limnobacter thiooxidans]|uniref:Uncharacterized protein n=1 Tax=Limnobacter thiooxidans TaxID=131080 RepID=A0AA86IYM9_9BURK|nr:hypothetical protein [Limnobacter sp.]MCZ8016352.1 hypothetical protein [Limnobacter sp.]RZS39786.1 hypothetical protein EV673_1542 [Limnobacter thiooxidans]BET24586.1 hypothetical protein RGQ30_00870 [Limnobacter thiooxidans]